MPRKPPPSQTASTAGARKTAAATRTLHIAVQGCCHGELDKIYAECKKHEDNWGKKIDFLLCCGDFQSLRDEGDFDSMAVPAKYRVLGDFHRYCCQPDSGGGEDGSAAEGAPTSTSTFGGGGGGLGHRPSSSSEGGKKMAPYLTIFIGGNHEASNVLFQNYYGGYVAPNIYYLGHSGVIDVMGLRLAGLSGIWKKFDSLKPYPHPPYDDHTVRSAYHVRTFEVEKLSLFNALAQRERRRHQTTAAGTINSEGGGVSDNPPPLPSSSSSAVDTVSDGQILTSTKGVDHDGVDGRSGETAVEAEAPRQQRFFTEQDLRPIDIFLSHDWPVGITKYGDEAQLLRYKPYFGPDIEKGELGNPLTMGLLTELQPRYWCSAHLHCSFSASVTHTETSRTQFLALDKCVRDKSFLDFIDITVPIFESDEDKNENTNNNNTNTSNTSNSGPATSAPTIPTPSFSSMMRRPVVAAARPPPKITIPALWVEVLRIAQPSLSESYMRGHLSLFGEGNAQRRGVGVGGGAVSAGGRVPQHLADSITLRAPPLKPITVRVGTNVGHALSTHWGDSGKVGHVGTHSYSSHGVSHGKRPRESEDVTAANVGAIAGSLPDDQHQSLLPRPLLDTVAGSRTEEAAPSAPATAVAETVDDWLIEG